MSTRFRVQNGTRSLLAPRLCDTCNSGIVRKGASESEEEVFCQVTNQRVETRVVECNRYNDRAKPSLWEMRQIAWVLQTDSRREKIGFLRAKEWERKHDDEELLPSNLE